jgi:hypothetical protein
MRVSSLAVKCCVADYSLSCINLCFKCVTSMCLCHSVTQTISRSVKLGLCADILQTLSQRSAGFYSRQPAEPWRGLGLS